MGRVVKKVITPQLVERFNDICMREFGFDVEENGHLYSMDTNEIFVYKDKLLKYCDEEDKIVRSNEIELNFLENSRLLEAIFGKYIARYATKYIVYINSFYQSTSIHGERGYIACSYVGQNGIVSEIRSDEFLNESVRIFNLLCKLNNTCSMYDFEMFDILTEYN